MRLFKSNDPAIADGGQRRDFVFDEDCIDHMLWLWKNPQASAFTTSGPARPERLWIWFAPCLTALGREPQIEFIDMPGDMTASTRISPRRT